MKLAQISALSAAIFMATAAQANFFEDATMNLELRNYYKNSSADNGSNEIASDQWSQAIRADLSTGYFENIVGLDLSAYYAIKLGASDASDGNPGLLPSDDKGNSHSYGKTAYAIKFNLMDMGVAKYGRMFLDTPLINDSDSRSLPSLTEAFYADFAYEGLTAFAVVAKKGNAKTEAGFVDYEVADAESVKSVGGAYDFGNGFALNAAYATQTDFAKKYLTEVTYATEVDGISLGLAAQYGKLSLLGATKDIFKTIGDDNSQSAYGLKLDAGVGQANFALTYTKVKSNDIVGTIAGAEVDGAYGYGWAGGDDDTGYFGYNSIQISDFNGNGQKAIGLSAGYDFAGIVDGLSASAIYVTGETDPKGGDGLDEKEYNIEVAYALPQVEGLTAKVQYAKNTREQSGSSKDIVLTDTRVIVKYNVAVF